MKDTIKKRLKRVIPFVLVGIMSVSSVFLSYGKAEEVQAAVVVDDIMLVTAILALCGVSFLGTEELWGNGNGWYPGIDAGADIEDWIDDFNKPWKEEWDKKTHDYALENGLIDENDNWLGGGGSGDGGDDDDHKFPSWQKIKNLVKANGGNVATALGAYLPLLTGFAQSILYDSGATLADSMIDDGFKIDESYINSNTVAYAYGKHLTNGFGDSVIFDSSSPVCVYKESTGVVCLCVMEKSLVYLSCFEDGVFLERTSNITYLYGSISSYRTMSMYQINGELRSSYPTFDNKEEAFKYLSNNDASSKKYINPTSIGTDSNLKDKIQTGVDGIPVLPTLPINNFAKLPTMDDLKDFFKKIGNDKGDKDKKQKDIDNFIKKITTDDTSGGETPDPDPTPTPDPGGSGGSGGGGGTTDTPDKDDDNDKDDKKNYARDLQKIFPFCIPFDLIDCVKLFNSEPETPKIEIPMHFGIVEKDYTFVIDLKDFDNVALILRSMLLILFVVGLGYATRNVIKW